MITHILADGTRTADITGHVVKIQDATTFYEIVKELNGGLTNEQKSNTGWRKAN